MEADEVGGNHIRTKILKMVDLMAWAGYFMTINPAEALRRKEKISHRAHREAQRKLKFERKKNGENI